MHRPNSGMAFCLFLAVAGSARAQAPLPPDDNPRGVNTRQQFLQLRDYPDALGVNVDIDTFPIYNLVSWLTSSHIQGVARSPRPGVPHVFFSVSGSDDPRRAGFISTAVMGSRDHLAERMRSNRLGTGPTSEIVPPSEDLTVEVFEFDGLSGPGDPLYWGWRHPGNLGVIGDVLYTPLEDPLWTNTAPWRSALALFDIGTDGRIEPMRILELNDNKAGVAAMTRLPNGRYFLIVAGPDDGRTLVGYLSTTTTLRDPDLEFLETFRWSSTTNVFGDADYSWPWDNNGNPFCPDGTDSHQGYAFVRDRDGLLFLIGMTRREACGLPNGFGSDYAELFDVILTFDAQGNPTAMQLLASEQRKLTLADSTIGFNGNFIAGAGVHISPAGTIILYGAPHGSGEPVTGDGASTFLHFAEIRTNRTNATGHPGPGTAYMELYEDKDYKGRSIVFDHHDRFLRPWWNLGFVDNFNDRTSSLRYCAPFGVTISIYENSNLNLLLTPLIGVDQFISIAEYGGEDRASSAGWTGSLSPTVVVGPPVAGQILQTGQANSPTWTVNGGLAQSVGTVQAMLIRNGVYPERVTFATPLVVSTDTASRVVIGAPD